VSRKWVWPLFTLIGPLTALAAIWGPLVAQYHVPDQQVDERRVEEARQPILREVRALLAERTGGLPVPADPGHAVDKARRLIETGRLQLGSFGEQKIELPFAPENLQRGSATWQFHVAALAVPRLFLDAYRDSGEREYLEHARTSILAWARFEEAQWLPDSFLWNDHSLAVRIKVLARFWQLYREHPDLLTVSQAREVLAFVSRSLRLTAKPGLYNPRTNHGLFQNLALWLGDQAFPGLPAAQRGAEVAYERFERHLPYYLGPDGVVLEHSAGYHAVGLSLVGRSFWYMDLAGQPIRESWWQRYGDGIAFYRVLLRPDGTLPRIGDTHPRDAGSLTVARRAVEAGVERVLLEPATPKSQASLYPVAGYAVDWRAAAVPGGGQRLGQTVLAWSNFPMAGHKHADELSLHFWAGGVDWWTGVGYWPYGHPDRARAEGWTEGNAPHFVGEPAGSERSAELLGQSLQGDVRILDLRRRNGGYAVRRQFLSLPDGTRIVLDTARDQRARPTEEIWRTAPTVEVTELGDGAFELREPGSGEELHAWFGGAGSVQRAHGNSAEGIRGMLIENYQPVATTSLVLQRPSGGEPSYVVWRRSAGEGQPHLSRWSGPQSWQLRVPGDDGHWDVTRDGRELSVRQIEGTSMQAVIEPVPPVSAAREEVVAAFRAAQAQFAGVRSLVQYRIKTTWVAGALLIAHALGLVALPFILGGLARASTVILLGWAGYVVWLRLYYFAS